MDRPFRTRFRTADRDKTVVWSFDTNAWKLFRALSVRAFTTESAID